MAFNVNQIPTTAVPGVQQGMLTANALEKNQLENQILGVKAQYAPMSSQAEAASKLAYANLMGPQFLAKLMGNNAVVANSPQLQDPATIQKLYQAGMGGGTGNALVGGLPGSTAGGNFFKLNSPLTNHLVDFMKNLFSNGGGNSNTAPQVASNNAMQNMGNQPSQPSNNAMLNTPTQGTQGQGNNSGYAYNSDGTNSTASPQQVQQIANQGNNTYAENTARQAGIVKEGEELGGARGKAIDELGKQYAQDISYMKPLDRLAQLSQSPTFMNMRQNMPYFQSLQLQNLGKIGNPEQQKIVGDFMADTKTAIANTVNSFNGRAMAKEFDFANMLKVGDNDTLGVMLGKLESLMTFKKAEMMRNDVARNLMQVRHLNEGDAYKAANSQVDMDTIRAQVAEELPTPVRMKNTKTGESKLVTPKEYNKMLTMTMNTGRKG